MKKVALNIGHHLNSQGAKGYIDWIEVSEYKFNSILAKNIIEIYQQDIWKNNIIAIIVEQDKYIDLPHKINTTEADICVSLHLNASENLIAKGTEVLYHHQSLEGRQLATSILNSLVYYLGTTNRGVKAKVKNDRGFPLLNGTKMPCVIIESGFISNSEELKLLLYNLWNKNLAKAIAYGIADYFFNDNGETNNYEEIYQ